MPEGTGNLLDGVHVLVADDCEDEREMLEFVFGLHGATVTAHASATATLSAVRDAKPDVLVSDIGLVGIDGYDLVRELRSWPADQGGETPAIALTGWSSESDRAEAIAAGFHVHIVKPVAVEALVAVVAALAMSRSAGARGDS